MTRPMRVALPDVISPMSRSWQKLPWYGRWIVYVIAIALAAVVLPSSAIGSFMSPLSDWPTVLFFPVGVYILLGLGLNVVVGQAGLLDLGYVAFFAIGGYAMGLLGTNFGWDFWEILPTGIAMSALAGIILGTPVLRLRGDYLAIVTLGFGEIVRIAANNFNFTGGPRGVANIPHPPSVSGVPALTYGILDAKPYYYLVLAFIVIAIIVVKRLERSRVGRAWVAIREDEDAAEMMGVPTLKFKLAAFAIGASIGGAGGVIWASETIFINPDNFQFTLSTLILAAVVLGGSGNVPGVILGAFLVAWLPERFRGFADYRVLVFGGALVLMMILRPEGLLPSRRRRAEMESGGDGASGGKLGAEVGGEEPAVVEAAE